MGGGRDRRGEGAVVSKLDIQLLSHTVIKLNCGWFVVT